MTGSFFVVPQEQSLLAAALGGDKEALKEFLGHPEAAALAGTHRLRQALALLVPKKGPEALEREELTTSWRGALTGSAGHHLLLGHRLREIGAALGEVRIPWLPFKGMDLASRVYPQEAQRPMSDIDLLVSREDGERALPLLLQLGWRDPFAHPRHERFLREEGYCWTLVHQDGSALEVHFRLWGLVPEGWSDAILERALPAPELGSSAQRPRLADAYLLAAVHAWMSPPPRPLLAWWDLEQIRAKVLSISDEGTFAEDIQEQACRWDLQLPVALAAGHAAALWSSDSSANAHQQIATALAKKLRRPERRTFLQASTQGTESITLVAITLARLLARRRGRTRLRGAWRRLWSHPGVVGRETPETWPWPIRRLWHQLKAAGLPHLADRLARRQDGGLSSRRDDHSARPNEDSRGL